MARLTDEDFAQLTARLDMHKAPEELLSARLLDREYLHRMQSEIVKLADSGNLEREITQRLARYLKRPVRCTFTSQQGTNIEEPVLYQAAAGELYLWLHVGARLVGALADAMIGGEGNDQKVGSGPKIRKIAAHAADEIFQCVAEKLNMPKPNHATIEPSGNEDPHPKAAVRGTCTISQDAYGWSLRVAAQSSVTVSSDSGPHSAPPANAKTSPGTIHARRVLPLPASEQSENPQKVIERALDAAAGALSTLTKLHIRYQDSTITSQPLPNLSDAWLRVGLSSLAQGVIVVSMDKDSASTLIDCKTASPGTLLETAAELALRTALRAFAGALPVPAEEASHIVYLSRDAMLVQVEHYGVVSEFVLPTGSLHIEWYVPQAAVMAAHA